jgi:hypothetical protein
LAIVAAAGHRVSIGSLGDHGESDHDSRPVLH